MGIFKLIVRAVKLMTPRERLDTLILLALMMVSGFLESMVVAIVLPLVYFLIDPQRAAEVPVINKLLAWVDLSPSDALPVLSLWMINVLVAASLLSGLTNYLSERQTGRCRDRLAKEILARAIGASYAWICQQRVAALCNTIYDDVMLWRRNFIQSLVNITQEIILICFPAAAAIALAPLQGFYALSALAVVVVALMLVLRKPLLRISHQSRLTQKRTITLLNQTLTGIREVKTSNRASVFLDAFAKSHRENSALFVKARILSRLPANLTSLVGQVGFILTTYILWKSGFSGAEITAQIAVIGVVVSRVVPAANRLSGYLTTALRAMPFVAGMIEMIDTADADRGWLAESSFGKTHLPRDWKSLRLEGVDFSFPGTDAGVKALDIVFERGRMYGVVGRSGAGKSTLMNLLLGLLAPTNGRIAIDGTPRETLNPSGWLEQMAYVPQDVFILDDTVAANIAFGAASPDASERMQAALRVACLDAVIADLPKGLETNLNERGRRFSGGQAQRVAIARAVFNRPTILLMDEATSALDHITEEQVQRQIRTLDGNPLIIAVAHRVSSLRNCDAILVMDGGSIIDVGRYDELLLRCPIFADLAAHSEEASAKT